MFAEEAGERWFWQNGRDDTNVDGDDGGVGAIGIEGVPSAPSLSERIPRIAHFVITDSTTR